MGVKKSSGLFLPAASALVISVLGISMPPAPVTTAKLVQLATP
ncbi:MULTISPECIES: hypothetical protein [unclassified Paenibacillus]|nr:MULTISPECIES: hypothetical protein [unclassified Paenibacillus]